MNASAVVKKYRHRTLLIVFFAMAMIVASALVWQADAALLKTTVLKMDPGKVYDISKADYSTQYTIEKSGDYWLKGSSTHAFVRIKGGSNVKLHLMDGLNIDTGMYSYVGDSVAAIIVEDFDGTVTLCTEAGANVQMSGYLSWPGIAKNGLKTKLVFMTADPSNQGTAEIDSTLTHFKSSPGIGSSWGGGHPFGNVVFESGKWVVVGTDAAAIGASKGNDVDGITINGGYIEAKHLISPSNMPCGPGIGVTGYGGTLKNLVINGGTVKAYGEYEVGWSPCAPGIGAGYGAQVDTITINGGTVRAYAGHKLEGAKPSGCSGIGVANRDAYTRNSCNAIIINGGDVQAYGGGTGSDEGFAGIGGAAVKRVEINGGTVRGEGSEGEHGIEAQNVVISGGVVSAVGGVSYSELYGSVVYHKGHGICSTAGDVRISGGTVTATRKDTGGSNKDINAKGNIVITGGSVDVSDTNKTPVNESGQQLKKTVFNLKKSDGSVVSDADVTAAGFDGLSYNYGIKDVRVKADEKLYFWLPDDSAVIDAETSDRYCGNVGAGQITDDKHSVFLGPGTDVNIRTSGNGATEGSAVIAYGQKKLIDIKMDSKFSGSGYLLEGFYLDSGFETLLADREGNLAANVKQNGKAVTDADGKWSNMDLLGSEITIFAKVKYTIKFDSNRPTGASTQISGDVGNLYAYIGQKTPISLTENYSLPGYDLSAVGWNTKPDGSGDSYKLDGTDVDLSGHIGNGGFVTLFAMWEPKKYTITFRSEEGGVGPDSQEAVFDRTGTLKKFSDMDWDYPGHTLHGWAGSGFGSFYDDGEDFFNLCSLDENGVPQGKTLTAEWLGEGEIKVTVTVDGVPKDVTDDIRIIGINGTSAELPLIDNGSGHYSGNLARLPAGNYQLVMESDSYAVPPEKQKLSLTDTSVCSVVLDFYTVEIKKDDHVSSAYLSTKGTIKPTDSLEVADDTPVVISAATEKGYHFDGYSVAGVEPEWEKDALTAEQTIKVLGQAEITAHAEADLYHIRFDSNAKKGVTGEMDDQDMVYGQDQALWKNRFERKGAEFDGWNTKADGSGHSIADGAEITTDIWDKMGPPANDSEVTLYAQWKLTDYAIRYDLAGGHLPEGKVNPEKYNIETPDITLTDPLWKDDSFRFIGWVGTDCSSPDKKLVIPTGSIGDRQYTAEWAEITYSVMFDTDGGTEIDTQTLNVHQKAKKPADPEREHYTFRGWYSDKECSKEFDFGKEITEDTIVYAGWDHIKREITYDLNGGKLNGKSGKVVIEANEGDVITIMDAPVRKGYSFKYWKGSKYYPGDDYKVTADHTLKAVWKKDKSEGGGGNKGNGGNNGNHGGANTGDDTGLPLWIALLGASIAALTGFGLKRIKRQ